MKMNNMKMSDMAKLVNLKWWSEMSTQELKLHCGEMTDQEIRTVRAVLNAINRTEG